MGSGRSPRATGRGGAPPPPAPAARQPPAPGPPARGRAPPAPRPRCAPAPPGWRASTCWSCSRSSRSACRSGASAVPPLVRRYIKTSFVFLVAGLLLGGWILVSEFVLGAWPPRLLLTAHVHLLLVGFMLMLVMGVATWMFPRPARDDARYRPELAEAVYWVLTLATAGRAAAGGGGGP